MRNCHTLLYSFRVRAGEYGITPLARPTAGRAAARVATLVHATGLK
jgi:hypothetical protein